MTTERPLLVVITGPTAVGKTSLAVSLATRFRTDIISADSRQFYHEMSIGTAVPTMEERAGIRHHFMGHLSVHQPWNVSRFENEVIRLLPQLFEKNPVVFLVGGSGLYIDAVCRGLDELPDPDPEIRETLRQRLVLEGISALQRELAMLDPDFYRQVDRANPARLIRAIEVCRITGIPYSRLRTAKTTPRDFRTLTIGLELPREELFNRINRRVDAMMDAGLYAEAEHLFPLRHLNALQTVGYRELFDHFEGKCDLPSAVEKIKTNTRRYAKRQVTWLMRDPSVEWHDPGSGEEISKRIRSHAGKNS